MSDAVCVPHILNILFFAFAGIGRTHDAHAHQPDSIVWFVSTALAVQAAFECARGQATLPEITVTPPKEAPKTKSAPKQQAKAAKPAVAPAPAPAPTGPPPESPIVTNTRAFNAARENILPKIGVSNYEISHQDIEALPQGTNAPLDKVLLQAPGVTMDSAASGSLHVRNEHANLQYRINGIIIPDGVSGFGQLLETSFVGSLSLVTGALPAQYGLRTSGLVDIQTRSGAQDPGGTISLYGGNRATLTPSIEYGGASGNTSRRRLPSQSGAYAAYRVRRQRRKH